MAVGAQHYRVAAGHPGPDVAKHRGVLGRHGVTHRVGQIDRGRPLLDGGLDHPAEEVGIGAAGVLGREFHIVGVLAGQADRAPGQLEHPVPRSAQLLPDMQVRCGDEDVQPGPFGLAQRLARKLDVPVQAARQCRHDRAPDLGRDFAHAPVVAFGCGRKAGFDDVDPKRVELAGQAELLLR